MADIPLGGTITAGGPFEASRQANHKGGVHQVANVAARDAIPSYLRVEGMECYVVDEDKSYRLVGGVLDANWEPVASGLSIVVYDFLNGSATTDVLEATPEVIGSVYFDPNSIIPTSSGRARHVTLEIMLETSNSQRFAKFDILDVDGIEVGATPGVPQVLGNSQKQTGNTILTRITQNMDAVLGPITAAGLLEARLAVENPGPAFVTCKMARLIVTWED